MSNPTSLDELWSMRLRQIISNDEFNNLITKEMCANAPEALLTLTPHVSGWDPYSVAQNDITEKGRTDEARIPGHPNRYFTKSGTREGWPSTPLLEMKETPVIVGADGEATSVLLSKYKQEEVEAIPTNIRVYLESNPLWLVMSKTYRTEELNVQPFLDVYQLTPETEGYPAYTVLARSAEYPLHTFYYFNTQRETGSDGNHDEWKGIVFFPDDYTYSPEYIDFWRRYNPTGGVYSNYDRHFVYESEATREAFNLPGKSIVIPRYNQEQAKETFNQERETFYLDDLWALMLMRAIPVAEFERMMDYVLATSPWKNEWWLKLNARVSFDYPSDNINLLVVKQPRPFKINQRWDHFVEEIPFQLAQNEDYFIDRNLLDIKTTKFFLPGFVNGTVDDHDRGVVQFDQLARILPFKNVPTNAPALLTEPEHDAHRFYFLRGEQPYSFDYPGIGWWYQLFFFPHHPYTDEYIELWKGKVHRYSDKRLEPINESFYMSLLVFEKQEDLQRFEDAGVQSAKMVLTHNNIPELMRQYDALKTRAMAPYTLDEAWLLRLYRVLNDAQFNGFLTQDMVDHTQDSNLLYLTAQVGGYFGDQSSIIHKIRLLNGDKDHDSMPTSPTIRGHALWFKNPSHQTVLESGWHRQSVGNASTIWNVNKPGDVDEPVLTTYRRYTEEELKGAFQFYRLEEERGQQKLVLKNPMASPHAYYYYNTLRYESSDGHHDMWYCLVFFPDSETYTPEYIQFWRAQVNHQNGGLRWDKTFFVFESQATREAFALPNPKVQVYINTEQVFTNVVIDYPENSIHTAWIRHTLRTKMAAEAKAQAEAEAKAQAAQAEAEAKAQAEAQAEAEAKTSFYLDDLWTLLLMRRISLNDFNKYFDAVVDTQKMKNPVYLNISRRLTWVAYGKPFKVQPGVYPGFPNAVGFYARDFNIPAGSPYTINLYFPQTMWETNLSLLLYTDDERDELYEGPFVFEETSDGRQFTRDQLEAAVRPYFKSISANEVTQPVHNAHRFYMIEGDTEFRDTPDDGRYKIYWRLCVFPAQNYSAEYVKVWESIDWSLDDELSDMEGIKEILFFERQEDLELFKNVKAPKTLLASYDIEKFNRFKQDIFPGYKEVDEMNTAYRVDLLESTYLDSRPKPTSSTLSRGHRTLPTEKRKESWFERIVKKFKGGNGFA